MAELTGKAISELPESTTVVDSALVAVSQSGSSRKMTLATLVGNLLKKTGDTMTGDLTILQSEPRFNLKDSEMDVTDVSPSQSNNILLCFRDKNNRIQSRIQGQFNTSGKSTLSIGPRRVVNGSEVGNYLDISVDVNGNRIIEVTSPAAWRNAIGLCYAANDTASINSSIVVPGVMNGSALTIYFVFHTNKSMENISTVTVTTMTGYIVGPSGAVNGSATNTNYTASPYSITCLKQDDHHVRIALTKSSAYTNVSGNTPVNYFGTLTLKFT